jgi:hypothetical protein
MDDDYCGAIGGIKIGRGNRNTRRKPPPAPLCPPKIPHCQNRVRNRATAVGSQRLTAWPMTRPTFRIKKYLCLGVTTLNARDMYCAADLNLWSTSRTLPDMKHKNPTLSNWITSLQSYSHYTNTPASSRVFNYTAQKNPVLEENLGYICTQILSVITAFFKSHL